MSSFHSVLGEYLGIAQQAQAIQQNKINSQLLQQELAFNEQMLPYRMEQVKNESALAKFQLDTMIRNQPTLDKTLEQNYQNSVEELKRIKASTESITSQTALTNQQRDQSAQLFPGALQGQQLGLDQARLDLQKGRLDIATRDLALASEIQTALSNNDSPESRYAIASQYLPIFKQDPEAYTASVTTLNNLLELPVGELAKTRLPGDASTENGRALFDGVMALRNKLGPAQMQNLLALNQAMGTGGVLSRGAQGALDQVFRGFDENGMPIQAAPGLAKQAYSQVQDSLARDVISYNNVTKEDRDSVFSELPEGTKINVSDVDALLSPDIGKGFDIKKELPNIDAFTLRRISPSGIKDEISKEAENLLANTSSKSKLALKGRAGPAGSLSTSETTKNLSISKLNEARDTFSNVVEVLASNGTVTAKGKDSLLNFAKRLVGGKGSYTAQLQGQTTVVSLDSLSRLDKLALLRQLQAILSSDNPNAFIDDLNKTNLLTDKSKLIINSLLDSAKE